MPLYTVVLSAMACICVPALHESSETAPIELKTRPTRNFARFKGFCTEIQGFCIFGCKSPGLWCKNLWKSFGSWIPNPGFLHRNPGLSNPKVQKPLISVQKPLNLVKFRVGRVLSWIGAVSHGFCPKSYLQESLGSRKRGCNKRGCKRKQNRFFFRSLRIRSISAKFGQNLPDLQINLAHI